MNKKFMFAFLGLFAVSLVAAGYVVNSFVLTTDVMEPFEVEYAIIGASGNWDGNTDCAEVTEWTTMVDVDVGGLYAGEDRKVCTRIYNLGEGEVDYVFSAEVISGNNNLVKCVAAFGNPSTSGTASGKVYTYNGFEVLVADDAEPVDNCEITLSVSRGKNA